MRSEWRIISVTLLVGVTLGLLAGCGSSSAPRKKTSTRKRTAPRVPPAQPVALPATSQIMVNCQEMKKRGAAKDLAGIQRLVDECLALDQNYAGDAYISAGAGVSEYVYATSPTGAERTSLYQKKIDYFQKAKAAFGAPGAKTTASVDVSERIKRCDDAIRMAQQELSDNK